MITEQMVKDAVERDESYNRRKQELRTQIDQTEGRIFELRETLRELHRESDALYTDVYDRVIKELRAKDTDAWKTCL